MTRHEVVAAATEAGLTSPRIIPHKDRKGEVSWHLKHGWPEDRKTIVLPLNVSAKALQKAIEANSE